MKDHPSRADIVAEIDRIAPGDAPAPTGRHDLETLRDLTAALVDSCGGDALDRDPFNDSYLRRVPILDGVPAAVAGRVMLVTGGEGYIGDHLTRRLAALGARRIVSVDNARGADGERTRVLVGPQVPVVRYRADVRRPEQLDRIFAAERPDVVFHLAAQRLPGLAEREVRRTVSTNLLGVRNVAAACEAHGVTDCVVASTAKAAQFLATDVYAGSKKLAEWWLAGRAGGAGPTRYAAARFTHVAENSPVAAEIDEKVQRDLLDLHAPDRFMQVQSVEEAVGLLLDALVLADPQRLEIVTVRDPGWPVDVLELALHLMRRTGRVVPVCFRGLPKGYLGRPFQGQFDWSTDAPSSMVNAAENGRPGDTAGALLVATPMPAPDQAVADAFDGIAAALDRPSDGAPGEQAVAAVFTAACRRVTAGSFDRADADLLAEILIWGCDPGRLEDPERQLREHRPLIRLLLAALRKRPPAHPTPAYERAAAFAERVAGSPDDVRRTPFRRHDEADRAWRAAG